MVKIFMVLILGRCHARKGDSEHHSFNGCVGRTVSAPWPGIVLVRWPASRSFCHALHDATRTREPLGELWRESWQKIK